MVHLDIFLKYITHWEFIYYLCIIAIHLCKTCHYAIVPTLIQQVKIEQMIKNYSDAYLH